MYEGPDNTMMASLELPGLKKEDVNIDLQNNCLTISGENKADANWNDNRYVVRERRFGKFSRTLRLAPGTQADKITA